jgi:hypothetical protein
MFRIPTAALVAGLALAPVIATAAPLGPAEIGRIFCAARITGDMAPVAPLLEDDLAALVTAAEAKSGAAPIRWQGKPDQVMMCMPVGARGTTEYPESVLAYGLGPGKTGFSDILVLHFVGDDLKLSDVKFAGGGTLREALSQ